MTDIHPRDVATPTETGAGKTAKSLRANEFSFEHAELVALEHPSKSLLWVRKAEALSTQQVPPLQRGPTPAPCPPPLTPRGQNHDSCAPSCLLGWRKLWGAHGSDWGTWAETDTELEQTVSQKPSGKATRYFCLLLPSPCPAMVRGWALSAFCPGSSAKDR